MFYLNSTLNFGIPPVLVFQLEVYYKVDRLLTGLTAQQKGTTAPWYSNKTSLLSLPCRQRDECQEENIPCKHSSVLLNTKTDMIKSLYSNSTHAHLSNQGNAMLGFTFL